MRRCRHCRAPAVCGGSDGRGGDRSDRTTSLAGLYVTMLVTQTSQISALLLSGLCPGLQHGRPPTVVLMILRLTHVSVVVGRHGGLS